MPGDHGQAQAALAERGMQWQVSIQDGTAYVSTEKGAVEITPQLLKEREA